MKAMLRAHSSPLPDDGFSRRVLAALPPARTSPMAAERRTSSWTWFAYFGGGTAGVAFAVSRVSNWPKLDADIASLADSFAPAQQSLTEPWLTIAFILCVLSLTIAWPFYRLDSGR